MGDTRIRNTVLGIASGFTLGLAAALLYAPKSGTSTRTAVKEKVSALRDKAEEFRSRKKPKALEMVLVVSEGCIQPVQTGEKNS